MGLWYPKWYPKKLGLPSRDWADGRGTLSLWTQEGAISRPNA